MLDYGFGIEIKEVDRFRQEHLIAKLSDQKIGAAPQTPLLFDQNESTSVPTPSPRPCVVLTLTRDDPVSWQCVQR